MAGKNIYNERGIVLGSVKYGESSAVAHLYTESRGRESFIVQGIKGDRGSSSKMAHLQPLFLVEFVVRQATFGQLSAITKIWNGVALQRTPFDPKRAAISLFMAEVIYSLVRDGQNVKSIFDLLWRSATELDRIESGVANYHLYFLTHLGPLLGFAPGNDYVPGDWFSSSDGLYTPCAPFGGSWFRSDIAATLHRFMSVPVEHLGDIKLSGAQRTAFIESLLDFYAYHLGVHRKIKSLDVLRELF